MNSGGPPLPSLERPPLPSLESQDLPSLERQPLRVWRIEVR